MIRFTASETARLTGGRLIGEDAAFTGVAIDSRAVQPGGLFAALPGNHTDGHDYLEQAAALGATVLLVSRPVDTAISTVRVDDVQRALGAMARAWKNSLKPLAIGITGSNGKTTTREMVARILQRSHSVLTTRGNYNNELGVPLTLFRLSQGHEMAVLELGASRAGDIAYLVDIATPDIGLVTNIGPAHLEGFGDLEGVARAKGELFTGLPEQGWAVMNGDEPWLDLWRDMCGAGQCLLFGMSAHCDVRAEKKDGQWTLNTPSGSFVLRLSLPGEHNVRNAAAATAVALTAGVSLEDIDAGLASAQPVPGRLNIMHAPGGWTVIDDTYNANPASLYAALQVLAAEGGEPWLVLGDMAELGPSSRKLHSEVGDAASALGVKRVFATGEASRSAVEAYGDGALHFPTVQALLEALARELAPGVTCLVKGSRSMGMERVATAIAQAGETREAG